MLPAGLAALANTVLRVCSQALDAMGGRGRGYATWQWAEVSAASLDQSGAMSTRALLRHSTAPYHDLGSHYIDAHQRGHITRHHVRRLESLGLNVEIRELPQTG